MLNKIFGLKIVMFSVLVFMPMYANAVSVADKVQAQAAAEAAEVAITEDDIAAEMEAVSADAVAAYNPDGSIFQQIIDLEQEKVLMELEKERAQLDLELDRLAAEKIKLHMEIDELSGRAEQQQQELENAQAKLEAEAAKLEREKEALEAQTEELAARKTTTTTTSKSSGGSDDASTPTIDFDEMYRLVNVIGAGAQLQTTIENLDTGQNRTVSVGKIVDGYTVQSISLDEGVVFTNGDDTQTLNITKSK